MEWDLPIKLKIIKGVKTTDWKTRHNAVKNMNPGKGEIGQKGNTTI